MRAPTAVAPVLAVHSFNSRGPKSGCHCSLLKRSPRASYSPARQVARFFLSGVKYNALSVDHLEYVGDEEIAALKGSETMPTVLPGAAFFLNMPYSPVRKMINAGLPVALASDFNPGSSPSGNMKFVMSLGCVNYKMVPEEVINATTINSAYAMGVEEELGSIAVGKKANFYITTPITGIEYLPYAYGTDLVEAVFLNGEQI